LSPVIGTISGIGLLGAFAGHISLLIGYDLLGDAWPIVFAGIFVVWFPTVLQLQKEFGAAAMQRSNGWKIPLVGAPKWVRGVMYVAFIYAIVNFSMGLLGVFSMKGAGFWRVGSSHAMVFYAAAWAFAVAANRRKKLRIDWKCRNGHSMASGAKFCDRCGAPWQPQL
jgi:hypothetical protein